MLNQQQITEAAFRALHKAAVETPPDVKEAFRQAAQTTNEPAKTHLEKTLENIDVAVERNVPVCPDTGWPLFFVKLGSDVRIEGGFSTLTGAFSIAVKRLTEMGLLRVTMVNPLTRKTALTNVGSNIPFIEYKPVSTDYIEITAVPKGGGAELFIPQPLRVLLLADGLVGLKKFVIDSIISGASTGKTCPPNVVGVGIGGTNDLCMKLAKQAALLRPIGDRHPESQIASLETELVCGLNSLQIGPMGAGGSPTVFDVHIEYALTHTAGHPVAINTQCSLTRRGTVRLHPNGQIENRILPEWFDR